MIAAALLGLVLLLGAGAASAQVTDGYSGSDATDVDNGSGSGSGTLPRTGADDALLLTAVGVGALALGGGVVLVAGRMRKAEVAA
jgi:LPXTG-motif cell wall-anchored protein